MALRLSSGLRNFLNEGGSLKHAFAGGKLLLYSGAQPTLANDAVQGTLLCTYTASSGAHTVEVSAKGTLTLDTGASGSVDTFTVNSIEIMGSSTAFDTSLTQTAANIVTKVNDNPKNKLFKASSSGAVITLTAKPGLGTLPNGWVVAATYTTITGTAANMGSGGAAVAGVNQVNGLLFGDSAAGALVKLPTQTWSGVAGASGTAGWFRLVGSVVDAGSADSSEVFHRLDGNVATSGANLNLSSTTITSAATQTISTFTITEPAA